MKKEAKQKKVSEYTRPCREVICPFCDHRFMWMGSLVSPQPTYYYVSKKTKEDVYDTVCPTIRDEILDCLEMNCRGGE